MDWSNLAISCGAHLVGPQNSVIPTPYFSFRLARGRCLAHAAGLLWAAQHLTIWPKSGGSVVISGTQKGVFHQNLDPKNALQRTDKNMMSGWVRVNFNRVGTKDVVDLPNGRKQLVLHQYYITSFVCESQLKQIVFNDIYIYMAAS